MTSTPGVKKRKRSKPQYQTAQAPALVPLAALASSLGKELYLCRLSVRVLVQLGSLLTLHSGLDFSQLALTG